MKQEILLTDVWKIEWLVGRRIFFSKEILDEKMTLRCRYYFLKTVLQIACTHLIKISAQNWSVGTINIVWITGARNV